MFVIDGECQVYHFHIVVRSNITDWIGWVHPSTKNVEVILIAKPFKVGSCVGNCYVWSVILDGSIWEVDVTISCLRSILFPDFALIIRRKCRRNSARSQLAQSW